MREIRNKNICRIVSVFLLLSLIFTSIPIYAEDVPNEMEMSDWAAYELIDAERYGIFEGQWYFEGFIDDIEEARFKELIGNIDGKVERSGIDSKDNIDKLEITSYSTRGDFLKSLFNIALKYDKDVYKDTDYIDYFQVKKVIKGNGLGLKLDKNISTEEAVVMGKRFVENIFKKNNLGAKGLMWEVENKGNKAYLLGSIHVGDSTMYPFHHSIIDRLESSDIIVVEGDLLNDDIDDIAIDKMYYKDGQTLKSNVDEATYDKVKYVMDYYEVDEEEYKYLKPWALSVSLPRFTNTLEGTGINPMYGIDLYSSIKFAMKEKEMIELEGANFQYDLFDKLSVKDQERILLDNINPIIENDFKNYTGQVMGLMIDLWNNGDLELFTDIFGNFNNPTFEDKVLLGDRDAKMAKKIEAMLESDEGNTYFIVIGAAHYVTEGTVIDILRDKGYEINRVNN